MSVLERAWYKDAWWLHLLRPFECLFRCATTVRRACYRSGLLPTFRPGKPVVIVGNITVGGTGKTPVVIALIEALHLRGVRAGVVSHGYGALRGRFPHSVDGNSNPAVCGDEALIIHARTQCPCVASPSRVDAVRMLLRDFEVDVVVCDDGLQHYALARDIELVLYDAQSGFGNGRCLPAGPLRESVRRLEEANFVLARHGAIASNSVRYRLDGLINVLTGEQRDLAVEGIGREVYAVAGIAQPDSFFDALRTLGFNLHIRRFPDHYHFREKDLSALTDKPILMTEKDAVKCRALVGENAWYLKVSATLPEAVIDAVVSLVKH